MLSSDVFLWCFLTIYMSIYAKNDNGVFHNSLQYKNVIIANFVLAMPLVIS